MKATMTALRTKDLLSVSALDAGEMALLFDTAAAMKADLAPFRGSLDGRAAVLLFEKPSLRTRVSFEVGLAKLGGIPMYFDHSRQRIGERESVKDYARNLERWVECIVARVFSQKVLEELAANCNVPVINALSDTEHPCQALGDFFTLRERFPSLEGVRLAWVGDGNNVCHSLMLAAAALGVHMTAITPKGFEPQFEFLRRAQPLQLATGATLTVTNRLDAVAGHHAVYTDVWTSMGQDAQGDFRGAAFEDYQVNEEVMAAASDGIDGGALFMHCLPAHRGQEVTDGVIDSPNSIVYDQAENRMHVQNALLYHLLAAKNA